MRICIPTDGKQNGESNAYGHFGSAPFFFIYDTELATGQLVSNQDTAHEHGNCNPIQAISAHRVDAVVVGGMGQRALMGLNQIGIKVYQANTARSIPQIITDFQAGALQTLTMEHSCSGHQH